MPIVMKVSGLKPVDGFYLKSFDPEAYNGRGNVEFTPDVKDAMKFQQFSDAILFRGTVPKCNPTRPDGEPNRPLTATDWEFEVVK